MALIPPQPIGQLPGSGLWNDWIEKIRSAVNTTLSSISWSIITGKPTTVAGFGITDAVTTSVTLDANRLILGNGAHDVVDIGSLGTTTTVLHGNAAGAPTFGAVNLATDVTGTLPSGNGGNPGGANPTGTIGLAAVNGAATTFLRSDGAPALSQAIIPTWTGTHTFTNTSLGWSVNTTGALAFASIISDIGNNAITASLFLGGGSSRGSQVKDFRGASSNVHTMRFHVYNTGDVFAADLLQTGQFALQIEGAGYSIKEGSNAKMGTATLVAGTVTVNTTAVTANSRIFLTSQTDGGTPGFQRITARTAGTSFTITSSSATDTSTIAWILFEPS